MATRSTKEGSNRLLFVPSARGGPPTSGIVPGCVRGRGSGAPAANISQDAQPFLFPRSFLVPTLRVGTHITVSARPQPERICFLVPTLCVGTLIDPTPVRSAVCTSLPRSHAPRGNAYTVSAPHQPERICCEIRSIASTRARYPDSSCSLCISCSQDPASDNTV